MQPWNCAQGAQANATKFSAGLLGFEACDGTCDNLIKFRNGKYPIINKITFLRQKPLLTSKDSLDNADKLLGAVLGGLAGGHE